MARQQSHKNILIVCLNLARRGRSPSPGRHGPTPDTLRLDRFDPRDQPPIPSEFAWRTGPLCPGLHAQPEQALLGILQRQQKLLVAHFP
jgi:hypothetical protein